MKTRCPGCNTDLPANRFFKNAGRPNGLSVRCKECFRAYEAGPERRAKRTWNTLHARTRLQSSYAHVDVRMTREEYLAWAIPAFTDWMANNAGTPSVDRIDPSGHYEVGNLRILERGENCRLASNHPNVHAQDGMAWCGSCEIYLPVESFWRSAGSFNGLQKRCKQCQNDAIRQSAQNRSKRPV